MFYVADKINGIISEGLSLEDAEAERQMFIGEGITAERQQKELSEAEINERVEAFFVIVDESGDEV